jgi:AraC-like DNA-binding protein
MLIRRRLLETRDVAIDDVACRQPDRQCEEVEPGTYQALVLVRRGCFVRRIDGVESLLDPTLAYFMNPAEEECFRHPQPSGDDCTAIVLDSTLAASIWGGEPALPSGPLPVPPPLDLAHRRLLAAAGTAADPEELTERAIAVVAAALRQVDAKPVAAGRPATARARRTIVAGARELLAADPGCPLPELARSLAVSPHHLSRIFRAVTGHTISRHRMRLRARAALERLAGGDDDLARLAADLGFADQSHLCRVVGAETGEVPSALREAIGGTRRRHSPRQELDRLGDP